MLHKDLNTVANYLEDAAKAGFLHPTVLATLAANVRALAVQASAMMAQPMSAETKQATATNIVAFPIRNGERMPAASA